ncbi:MAG: hypothetical protein HYX37_12425 [Rhizobiales bacterium]|nr:hypothetical protein [Hyphomicrobiales bacterium]
MPAWKDVPPELIAECKYLYEETLTPTHEIGAKMGLSRSAFYLRVRDWNWQSRRYRRGLVEDVGAPANTGLHFPPQTEMAESSVQAEAVQDGAPEARPVLAVRISKAVHQQIDLIDCIQKLAWPSHSAQAERSARIVAIVNKSLIEIAATTKSDKETPQDAADDDPVPRDIDEFRNELARRIRGLIEARRVGGGGGDDATHTRLETPRT